jgi:hypothetical protein
VTRVIALALVAGCLKQFEPDVGPPLRAACQDAAHDPSHQVRFATDVDAVIVEYKCRDCHTPTGMTPIGYQVSGLDLTSYDTLRAGGLRSGMQIVVPGRPCESVLLQKVSDGPPYGARMPLDGTAYLGDDDLAVISDWIFEGALDD